MAPVTCIDAIFNIIEIVINSLLPIQVLKAICEAWASNCDWDNVKVNQALVSWSSDLFTNEILESLVSWSSDLLAYEILKSLVSWSSDLLAYEILKSCEPWAFNSHANLVKVLKIVSESWSFELHQLSFLVF